MSNPDKLLVLIHGSGAVRAGQWARRLVLLLKGTFLATKKLQLLSYMPDIASLGKSFITLSSQMQPKFFLIAQF